MVWFSALKLGLNAATHIYKKRQETKMAMADAQHMHAAKMARGEEQYQGKLLEARQSDWKDEFVLLVLSAPIAVLAWAVISEDPTAMDKVKLFFEYFSALPQWFTNLWILVVASIYGIKGTQIFRNGKKIMSENSSELLNEYKEQIRILRQEVAELQDAGKSKDAANKRCLQKLEHTNKDLEDAIEKIKKLEEKNDKEDIRKDKKSLG